MAVEIILRTDPMTGEEISELEEYGMEFIQIMEIPNYSHGNYWHYFRAKTKKTYKKKTKTPPKDK